MSPSAAARVVVVDWSASAAPARGKDSIWVAWADGGEVSAEPVNPPTRDAAMALLRELCAVEGPVVMGFDFPFGYPAGTAARLGLDGPPWAATWAHVAESVADDDRNRNNRFDVARDWNRRLGAAHFWGVPAGRADEWLTVTRPPRGHLHLPEYRLAEQRLRAGGSRPFSVWQAMYTGSVGSQALVGIARLHRFRHDPARSARVRVWPFETGFRPPAADEIVLAEVWPSMQEVAARLDPARHGVKDAQQVIACAEWLARQPDSIWSPLLASEDEAAVLAEEGWVLGLR